MTSMNNICKHSFTKPNGDELRCKDAATETGYCAFHSHDWEAAHARRDAEASQYAEETGGRNLFLDRLTEVSK